MKTEKEVNYATKSVGHCLRLTEKHGNSIDDPSSHYFGHGREDKWPDTESNNEKGNGEVDDFV